MQNTSFDEMNDVALVRAFIGEYYDLHYNVLSGHVEMSNKPMTSRDRNDLLIAAREKFPEIIGLKSIVSELLDSNSITEFNPVCKFIDNLPEWDKVDHVGELFGRISGITERQKRWARIWLRGVFAQWSKDNELYGNQCVLTLIGDQGCRKSTFLQMLLPEELREYYLDSINLSNQFSRDMALTNNLLVNIDEMDQIKPSQQAALKFCITRPFVNGRPIYGKTQAKKKRYASFVATTNSPHPLQDPTGSRRFICIQIPAGEIIDVETSIDYQQLYAQVRDELDNQKMRSWFTDEEVAEIQKYNLRFQTTSDLGIMLDNCFAKPETDDGAAIKLSLKDIAGTVVSQYPNAARDKALDVRLGIQLTNLGYERTHTKKGNVYNVLPLVA